MVTIHQSNLSRKPLRNLSISDLENASSSFQDNGKKKRKGDRKSSLEYSKIQIEVDPSSVTSNLEQEYVANENIRTCSNRASHTTDLRCTNPMFKSISFAIESKDFNEKFFMNNSFLNDARTWKKRFNDEEKTNKCFDIYSGSKNFEVDDIIFTQRIDDNDDQNIIKPIPRRPAKACFQEIDAFQAKYIQDI